MHKRHWPDNNENKMSCECTSRFFKEKHIQIEYFKAEYKEHCNFTKTSAKKVQKKFQQSTAELYII